jgi:site-specific DNA-methyltransferase (adenine-specific)
LIRICNKRKRNYYISQSAVKDGNYYDFLNLESEIKNFISSINAIPVERNKGLDGIFSSAEGLVGIRFQRNNESVSEVITLMNKAAKEKSLIKKLIIKTHDSDPIEIVPNDIFVLESLAYNLNKIIKPIDNKSVNRRYGV